MAASVGLVILMALCAGAMKCTGFGERPAGGTADGGSK